MVTQYRTSSAAVFKDIYVDIIDERSFNALAFVFDSQEYVGINAGVGISLTLLFLSLLSHPEVLPHLDASAEEKRPVSLDRFVLSAGKFSDLTLLDFPYSSLLHPQSDLRFHHATYLSIRALGFLLLHEIGHIGRCHLSYLRERGLLALASSGALALLELGQVTGDAQSVRRVLECDADSFAARAQVEALLCSPLADHAKFALGPDSNARMKWEDVAYLWLISVGVLFQLLATRDKSPIAEAARTHAHPDLRFAILANFAWSSWNKVIPDPSTYSSVANRARDDLWGIWMTLNLPGSQARQSPAYEADFKKAHLEFQKGFAAIAARLNELSMERINGTSAI